MGAQVSFCQGSGACIGQRSAPARALSLDEKLKALAADAVREGHIMRNGSMLTSTNGVETSS